MMFVHGSGGAADCVIMARARTFTRPWPPRRTDRAAEPKEIAVVITVPTAELLTTLAEPTRLRILKCIAAAPLFASDLAAILQTPESVIAEHLESLRNADLVRDMPLASYVLYQSVPFNARHGRILTAVLEAVRAEPAAQGDRAAALARSRSRLRQRVATIPDAARAF
jgi:DNA-binding transcriptional ArsR family regulator